MVTPVSPNKTLVGFIAGFCTSIGVAVLTKLTVPDFVPMFYPVMVLIGGIIGFTTILGDLVESALKRSSQLKDTGNLIPGRGGVLDSLDSALLSAPVFYFLMKIFYV